MGVTNYATLDGEIVSVSIDGVRKDLIPDPLGSVAALVDSTGTITDTFTYWPYGEERTRTGTTEISTRFVGAWGYYWDNPKRDYVRARYLEKNQTRWLTVDPLWPSEAAYGYVSQRPLSWSDPMGLQDPLLDFVCDLNDSVKRLGQIFVGFPPPHIPRSCETCVTAMNIFYQGSKTHHCHHGYTHCMTCCILSRFGDDCALAWQARQNHWTWITPGKFKDFRDKACGVGVSDTNGASCHEHCSKHFGGANTDPKCKDVPKPREIVAPPGC